MIRPLLPAAALVALAAALAGCASASDAGQPAASATTAPANRGVAGALTLDDPAGFTWSSDTGCVGTGGYADIREGAQVVITDAAGATIGLGKLDQGKLDGTLPGRTADICKFTFHLASVPSGKGFYGVEVAHRGTVQYPEDKVFGALALTLG
ncbi:hypothetical protein [Micromonospora sp. RTGN7]|uniref:hypothetical protein n=1 Tax=Micromonospora sp. RTGN7 TaxID=3016526 RepID=UPI0029FECB1A|nr:hypothetical protein [Micromonospora sp. RTGN7]